MRGPSTSLARRRAPRAEIHSHGRCEAGCTPRFTWARPARHHSPPRLTAMSARAQMSHRSASIRDFSSMFHINTQQNLRRRKHPRQLLLPWLQRGRYGDVASARRQPSSHRRWGTQTLQMAIQVVYRKYKRSVRGNHRISLPPCTYGLAKWACLHGVVMLRPSLWRWTFSEYSHSATFTLV